MDAVSASEVLKRLAKHFRSVDLRAAVVDDAGTLRLVQLGVRVSMRPVGAVRDHYAQLERKFGPRKATRFKVLWEALSFTRVRRLLGQLGTQTLRVEGQDIALARRIDLDMLRGTVMPWPQSELLQEGDDRWPSVLFSAGRSPSYDQTLQLCRSAEVSADVRQRTRSRGYDGHIDAFLEVANSSRYDRDIFLHMVMPARITDIDVGEGHVTIRAEGARTLSRLRAFVEVQENPDRPPVETLEVALSETKESELAQWEGAVRLAPVMRSPYVAVFLRTLDGFEIDEMHGPRPRQKDEIAASSATALTTIFGLPDLREDGVPTATAADSPAAALLGLDRLEPELAAKVGTAVQRGDFEQAVFQAYKEVEVRVRKKAGLPDDVVGVFLMRTAFHPETGALTDNALVAAERQARSDLFAGAIGSFKNPPSHREFPVSADAATELIYLANYLLRIVG
ncbi:MAG TPA: TIGR02391 family protein [Methylomirabilota bacterium]|nr:TIGR02391 family protein [Methylomirabilota bacterium]